MSLQLDPAALAGTLRRVGKLSPVDSSEVTMVIAPPLTGRVVRSHLRKGFLRSVFGRPREFVRRQSRLWTTPDQDYMEQLGLPVLAELGLLRENTSAVIVPDVTFRRFRKELRRLGTRVLFLVAHHAIGTGIEFGDGIRSWHRVERALDVQRDVPLAFIFLVCQAEATARATQSEARTIGTVAFASWELQMTAAVRFARAWIECLDGKQTIWDAYNNAIGNLEGTIQSS